jgi:hypothetical protein
MGVVYLAMYVDDCLCMGDNKAIRNAIAKIGNHFKLKIEETLNKDMDRSTTYDQED